MITLARNRAVTDAVLLSGDEDLRVGVQQAQEFGVRVHLLGIRPSRGSQSLLLLQEADSTHEWGPDDLTPFLSCKPAPAKAQAPPTAVPAAPVAPVAGLNLLDQVASEIAGGIEPSELETLIAAIEQSGQTPKEIDGRLLAKGGVVLKTRLDPAQKKEIRNAFLRACERRLAETRK